MSRLTAIGILTCSALLILAPAGCAKRSTPAPTPPPAPLAEARAVWVTRFEYRTADDVRRIIRNCADAGFNIVLFQVRGNGTAFYRSRLEPWAVELGGRDPGFDPLAVACEEARARRVQLHAWVNVMPAWRGTRPPLDEKQLYNRKPEWFWYDQEGKRQALSSFYVSLNPCLPEVRQYIVEVFREIVAEYPVDGLHLDYIRFPSEPPASPPGGKTDYPRDAVTLAIYKAETGLAPDDDPAAWKRWRTEQVTRLVADIRAMMRQVRPTATLTAAVVSVAQNGLNRHQDGVRWVNDDLVDAAILMNYTNDPAEFDRRIDPWLLARQRGLIIPGLSIGRSAGKPPEEAHAAIRRMMEIGVERTGSFAVFSYSSLFDTREPPTGADGAGSTGTAADGESQVRAARREALLPVRRAP
ncbi:MAG: family 10 glycosylhydrolase [Phycisphaerales bacterium]|nr:family 10 glycosylhydrolase [Phycisphaerales bacterium]